MGMSTKRAFRLLHKMIKMHLNHRMLFYFTTKWSIAIVTRFAMFYLTDSFSDSDTGLDFLIENNGKLD